LGVKPRFVLPATAIPAAVVIGTLASVVAAAVPGRTAVRVPPVEAMRPEGVLEVADTGARVRPVVTTLGAVILVAGTLVMVLGSKSLVSVGFGATTVGVLILTFGVSGLIAVGVARLAARIGAVGRLAAAGIERAPRRVWATTLAVTIGVAIVVALGGLVSNQNETFAADFHSMTESAFWVQAGAADSIPTQAQLPSGWVAQIRAIPGVGAVRHNESAYIALNDEQVLLDGLDPGSNVPFVRGAGPAGPRALNGDGVIAAKSWAKRHGMHVGDAVTIATPSGRQSPRIVALSDVPDPVQGELAVDYTRFAQWFRGGALTAIEVAVPSRADLAAVQSSLVRLVATAPVAIHVYTGAEEWAGARKSLTQITAIFTAVVWVIVLATALAVLNTMAITVVERRRELGILRAVGTSRGMISRMVLVEAAVITVSGLAMGVLLGLLQQAAGIRATATVTGFTVRYRLVIAPLVTAAIAAAVMTVGGAIGPAWRAARVDVIPAIGYE
jgi:putative ABC transport system permease protein